MTDRINNRDKNPINNRSKGPNNRFLMDLAVGSTGFGGANIVHRYSFWDKI